MAVSHVSDDEFRTFTSELCDHLVASRFESLESHAIESAKVCFLDWLGLAIRGSKEELACIIHDVISLEEISGSSSIVGTSIRTNELFAALANGAQGHAMDYDDTHEPSLVHVSASLWPAIMATATSRACSGERVIAAFMAGVDAQADIGRSVGAELTSRGFHATSIIGHMGAVIAVCNLLRLDAGVAELALGISATQAGGLSASFGTMSKPLHPGKAAMDALLSVRLAENGFTGSRDVITRSNGLLETLLGHIPNMKSPMDFAFGHAATEVSIKPYPSCLLTHPSIDAARYLSAKLDCSQIDSVIIRVNPLAIKVAGKSDPKGALEGKFSIQYCAAVALQRGEVRVSDFDEEHIRDENTANLVAKVKLIPDESISVIQSEIDLHLKDGRRRSHRIDVAKGNPANPMTIGESLVKFDDLVEPILGSKQSNSLAKLCLKMEVLSDFRSLLNEATKKN